jgi:acetamidase/formamidase
VFGCGDASSGNAESVLAFSAPVSEAAYAQAADRLRHSDALNRDLVDWLRETRLQARSAIVAGVGIFGLLAPVLASLSGSDRGPNERIGRLHTLPSTPETVRLGVFDSTVPSLLEIESGDVVVYPDTWSHFLNRMQPGVTLDELARLRRENPGRGPHSIVGPVSVCGAQPFPQGQIRYLDFDLAHMRTEFLPGIHVPLRPFQGTFAVAPAAGGVVSSVPPGQHAGNIDLRDLTEGSTLFVPVWQPEALLFTGDSHAAQGDGEVNNQAIESAMREVRVRVVLHKNAGWAWPFAETSENWIAMGMDPDLNEAFRIATRNVIDFLHRRAGLTPIDAYSLASIAISFRVTQFVNQTRGVHALIPKSLFSTDLRRRITIL